MAQESLTKPYNERLLNTKTFRGRLHFARFIWLQNEANTLGLSNNSILELGSYDGKAIQFLNNPSKYTGYDANWENGLELAKERWKDHPEYTFHECTTPAQFNPSQEIFDITICQEVLEHLRSPHLEEYIKVLAASTRQYCFVTVPNEQGFFFLLKFIWKKLTQGEDETYNFKEVVLTTLGKPDKVTKSKNGHKGFAYKVLLNQLSEYFEVVHVKGIPFKWLPKSLNFSICILLKPKHLIR